jgi:hypothetical protein
MDLTTPFSQRSTTVKHDAANAGHGMTPAELHAFLTDCQAKGIPADAKIMVRVNITGGIKSMWTKN